MYQCELCECINVNVSSIPNNQHIKANFTGLKILSTGYLHIDTFMDAVFDDIINGDGANLKELLSHVVDVNETQKDSKKYTIAHLAALEGILDMVTVVLAQDKIDLTVEDQDGRSPLHVAVLNDRFWDTTKQTYVSRGIVKLFLKAHADVTAVDHRKNTPLHVAVMQNDFDSICLLLEFNASLDAVNADNETPKTLASQADERIKTYLNTTPPDHMTRIRGEYNELKSIQTINNVMATMLGKMP
jgi:ankyrin repeat protein